MTRCVAPYEQFISGWPSSDLALEEKRSEPISLPKEQNPLRGEEDLQEGSELARDRAKESSELAWGKAKKAFELAWDRAEAIPETFPSPKYRILL